MRAIITGGTGLIGSALAANLAGDGYDVVVLSRRAAAPNLPAGVRAVQWDGRSASGWGQLADGASVIINLAGENISSGRWTAQRKQRITQSRVDAGHAVVEAVSAAQHKPDLVIQMSGIGHYGMHADDVVTEQNAPGNDFGAQVTLVWEEATRPVEAMGVRRVILRTAPVLSTRGGVLPKMMLPFHFFVGGKMGSGKQWFSWVHMADAIGAMRFLMADNQVRGAYNLCAPNPVTNAQFSRALGRAMHRPSLVPVPAFALQLALGEMSTVLVEGQRGVPQRLLDAGYTFHFAGIDAALADLLGRHTDQTPKKVNK